MADVKISALPAATAVAATDVAPVVVGTVTQKATAAQIVKGALDAAPATIAQGGTGATTAAAARTALGLGSIALANSPLAPTSGGTGVVGTLTGIVKGNGIENASNATGPEIVSAIGATAVQRATVADNGGVTSIIAGTNVTISPVGGTGAVTINASGGGGGSLDGVTQSATPFLTALGNGASTTATGINNTFVGKDAGKVATSATNNTFVGAYAGKAVTTGNYNTAIGDQAAPLLVGGSNNTVMGSQAMSVSTAGTGNTVIGREAGKNLTGDYNVLVGFQAGDLATTMGNSVLIGTYAGAATQSGANNLVGVGYAALNNLTTGAKNTAVGNYAGAGNQTGADTTNIGDSAGRLATGNNTTCVGSQAGVALTSGANNTFIGKGSGSTVTTGGNNTLVGAYAGTAALAGAVVLSDGAGNVRLATNSGGAVSFDNTSFGTAGQVLTSQGNAARPTWTSVGASLTGTTLSVSPYTTSLGFGANTAATGINNTFIGHRAGELVTSGQDNLIIGDNAGNTLTTGNNNILIGTGATGNAIVTGSGNVIIGNKAGTSAMTNQVIITDGVGDVALWFNDPGAMSFDGTNFGIAGQVLQSNGTSANPTWVYPTRQAVRSVVTPTTLSSDYGVTFAEPVSANLNLTLPDATQNKGLTLTVKRTDSATDKTLTMLSLGGMIEGAASTTIGINVAVTYCSDGTNWWELANS